MNETLRETATHGNQDFPFALYHMHRYWEPCAFSLHWHEEMEIIYIQQGILYLTIDKTHYIGREGDIFVVNSRVIHEMSVRETPTVYVTVLFPLDSLLFQRDDAIMEQYLHPLVEERLRLCETVPGSFPQIRQKIERMIMLYHNEPEHYRLQIRILVLDILCDFFIYHLIEAPEEKPQYLEKHREILAYIQENFLHELSLETIAERFHMVPKYFSRYFKKHFHIALTDYINHLRLEKAADLLRHTELPITEIAIQTGFNSSSYFNKKFREGYGKTPTEYRNSK